MILSWERQKFQHVGKPQVNSEPAQIQTLGGIYGLTAEIPDNLAPPFQRRPLVIGFRLKKSHARSYSLRMRRMILPSTSFAIGDHAAVIARADTLVSPVAITPLCVATFS
jgi:hypothetical protein